MNYYILFHDNTNALKAYNLIKEQLKAGDSDTNDDDTKSMGAAYRLGGDSQAKSLKSRLKATLAPTPRKADKCCGVAVLLQGLSSEDEAAPFLQMLKENAVEIAKTYIPDEADDPDRLKFS